LSHHADTVTNIDSTSMKVNESGRNEYEEWVREDPDEDDDDEEERGNELEQRIVMTWSLAQKHSSDV